MIADISLIVTAVGVLGAMVSLRQSYLERLRQFELKYIDRYWAIIDRLSPAALRASSGTPTDQDEKAIWSYLYLCEDEIDMREHGYISDDTYLLWAEGIRTQLEQPMFKEIWGKVSDAAHRGEGEHPFDNLQNLKSGKQPDPLSMGNFARFVRGLIGAGRLLELWHDEFRAMNPFRSGKAAAESLTASVTTNPQKPEPSTVEPVPAGDASPPS